jgi:hypothetical protein
MVGVRRAYRYGLYAFLGNHGFNVIIGGDTVGFAKDAGTRQRAVIAGHQLRFVQSLVGFGMEMPHLPTANDSSTDTLRHGSSLWNEYDFV